MVANVVNIGLSHARKSEIVAAKRVSLSHLLEFARWSCLIYPTMRSILATRSITKAFSWRDGLTGVGFDVTIFDDCRLKVGHFVESEESC